MSLKTKIQQLIAQNKTKDALALMAEYTKQDSDKHNMVIGWQGSFARNEQEKRMGIIADADYGRQLARLHYNILSVVSEIDDVEITEPIAELTASLPQQPPQRNGVLDNHQQHPQQQEAIPIFISYAHKDENYKDELVTALAALRRTKQIADWDDRDIIAGEEWNEAIFENLHKAKIILLLVSNHFISSDFCYNKELNAALEKAHNGQAIVVPIIIRPCDFHELPFAKFQAVPKNAKAISTWENQDEAWLDVSQSIKKAVRKLRAE